MINGTAAETLWLRPPQPRFIRVSGPGQRAAGPEPARPVPLQPSNDGRFPAGFRVRALTQDVEQGVGVDPREDRLRGLQGELLRLELGDRRGDVGALQIAALLLE